MLSEPLWVQDQQKLGGAGGPVGSQSKTDKPSGKCLLLQPPAPLLHCTLGCFISLPPDCELTVGCLEPSTKLSTRRCSIVTCWKEGGDSVGEGKRENMYHWGEVEMHNQRAVCFPFLGITGSVLLGGEKISRNICESLKRRGRDREMRGDTQYTAALGLSSKARDTERPADVNEGRHAQSLCPVSFSQVNIHWEWLRLFIPGYYGKLIGEVPTRQLFTKATPIRGLQVVPSSLSLGPYLIQKLLQIQTSTPPTRPKQAPASWQPQWEASDPPGTGHHMHDSVLERANQCHLVDTVCDRDPAPNQTQ